MNFVEASTSIAENIDTDASQEKRARSMALYEAARVSLAEAMEVDDILEVMGRLDAIREYFRRSRDRSMEINCGELRIRAKRRLGEELIIWKENGLLYTAPEPDPDRRLEKKRAYSRQYARDRRDGKRERGKPTVKRLKKDLGISGAISAEAQRHARIPEETFEKLVTEWRARAQVDQKRVVPYLPSDALPRQNLKAHVARAVSMQEGMKFRAVGKSGGKRLGTYSSVAILAAEKAARDLVKRALWDIYVAKAILSYERKMISGKTVGEILTAVELKRIGESADRHVAEALMLLP